MKKRISIVTVIILFCLTFSAYFFTACAAGSDPNKTDKTAAGQKFVFSKAEYDYGYDDIRGQKFSCEGFWIDGEEVYLLDTLNSRVLKQGKDSREYTFDNVRYAKDIAFFEDRFYILDAFNKESAICVFDSEMKFLYRLEFGTKTDGDMLDYFFIDSKGNLSVLCLGTGYYYAVEDGKIVTVKEALKKSLDDHILTYSDGSNSWKIEFDNMFVRPIGVIDGTFYYFKTTMADVPGVIDGENTVEAVDKDGNFIGAELYLQDENSFIPNKLFQFVNGKLFTMSVNDKEVVIYEVVLDHEFEN